MVDVALSERLTPEETYERVRELDGERGLVWLEPSAANNTYALAMHVDVIRDARVAGIDLLVFPELSLTGYRLRRDIPRVACRSSHDRLLRLAKLVGPMQAVVGFVEDCGPGEYANAVAVMQEGQIPAVHRKLKMSPAQR